MLQTDDIVHWPVLRLANGKFLRRVERFFVYNFGKSALLLTRDSACYAIGENDNGFLGLGHTNPVTEPVEVVELRGKKVVQCAVGWAHVVVLTKDGDLYTWGLNGDGQLGCGNEEDQLQPVLVMKDITMVASGAWHTAALRRDGTVFCWGGNDKGQLGLGLQSNQSKPVEVTKLKGFQVVHIDCGSDCCVALTDKAQVFLWGDFGRFCQNTPSQVSLSGLTVASLTCGQRDFILLTARSEAHHCYYDDEANFCCDRLQLEELVHSVVYPDVYFDTSYCLKLQAGHVVVWNSVSVTNTSLTSLVDTSALYCKPAVTPGLTTLPSHAISEPVLRSISYFNHLTNSDVALKVDGKVIYLNIKIACKLSSYLTAKFQDSWKDQSTIKDDNYSFVVWFTYLRYVLTDTLTAIEADWACHLLSLATESAHSELRDMCINVIASNEPDLSKLTKDDKHKLFLSLYLTQNFDKTNCCQYYQLAVDAQHEELQEQIVELAVKLEDEPLQQFITNHLTPLRQKSKQWCHITRYMTENVTASNCSYYYSLAVKANDNGLQEQIVQSLVSLTDDCQNEFIKNHFDQLRHNASQWHHVTSYVTSNVTESNCDEYYQLALDAQDQPLQEQIVKLVVNLKSKCQQKFIAKHFDQLRLKEGQWSHISHYLTANLNETNCCQCFQLAVEAEDVALQQNVSSFVLQLDLETKFALYVTKGYGLAKSEHIEALFAQVYNFGAASNKV